MFHRVISAIGPALLGIKTMFRRMLELIKRFIQDSPNSEWERALFNAIDLFTMVWTGGKKLKGVVAA